MTLLLPMESMVFFPMSRTEWVFILFAVLWLTLATSQLATPPISSSGGTSGALTQETLQKPPVLPQVTEPPRPKYVFIILVDGLRPDALQQARTPFIDSLWRDGAYTWKAQTTPLSLTLPAATSLLTGLTVEDHGVNWNSWDPDRGLVRSKTLFDLAHATGFSTAFFAGKKELAHLNRPTGVDYFEIAGDEDDQVMPRAIAYIELHKPQLVFIHLPSVDEVGHATHWMSKQQLQAVEKADQEMGSLLQSLEKMGIKDQSLILLTSDHGGHGKFHGSDDSRDTTIPWVLWGVGVQKNHEITGTVHIWDSAPTILQALRLSNSITAMDGQPVQEAFVPSP